MGCGRRGHDLRDPSQRGDTSLTMSDEQPCRALDVGQQQRDLAPPRHAQHANRATSRGGSQARWHGITRIQGLRPTRPSRAMRATHLDVSQPGRQCATSNGPLRPSHSRRAPKPRARTPLRRGFRRAPNGMSFAAATSCRVRDRLGLRPAYTAAQPTGLAVIQGTSLCVEAGQRGLPRSFTFTSAVVSAQSKSSLQAKALTVAVALPPLNSPSGAITSDSQAMAEPSHTGSVCWKKIGPCTKTVRPLT